MKKNVIVFGLLSGFVITVMMVYSISQCYNNPNFEPNMVLGYAAMLAAFSFVFIGVRNYRNNYNNGYITFGKAFKTGLYISLIASTIYVGAWLIDYYLFIPDFMDKYTLHVLNAAEKDSATTAELASKAKEMADFAELYKNPVWVVLITYSEVLPPALALTLVSALILKKKPKAEAFAE